jgi:hypothetical protein
MQTSKSHKDLWQLLRDQLSKMHKAVFNPQHHKKTNKKARNQEKYLEGPERQHYLCESVLQLNHTSSTCEYTTIPPSLIISPFESVQLTLLLEPRSKLGFLEPSE